MDTYARSHAHTGTSSATESSPQITPNYIFRTVSTRDREKEKTEIVVVEKTHPITMNCRRSTPRATTETTTIVFFF